MPHRFTITLLIGLALAGALSAAGRFEITPMALYRIGGEFEAEDGEVTRDLLLEGGPGFGLTFGVDYDQHYQLEFSWLRQQSELREETGSLSPSVRLFDLNVDQYQFNGLYHWLYEGGRVRPFLIFGIGATYLDPVPADVDGSLHLSVRMGGGVKLGIGKHAGVRVQGCYVPTYVSEETRVIGVLPGEVYIVTAGQFFHQLEASGGFYIRF